MTILVLIARILLLIAEGLTAMEAVSLVSNQTGVSFSRLWSNLPSKYK
ncbi:hypothetical protein [Caldisalinibacter kiritimatiensis]|uniref:Uncharacterized protein n=1 Tax=Caldisalinibacter kiritimatiensis TaxID=1304284 RepID=R1AU50_9FIRM|nr:hypothetical protein [Caldisalinibacter kiritimatiensis]EOD00197.1 hypothetical protein L21TH_1773 [Caldisalinibacter kiritimatiensis]